MLRQCLRHALEGPGVPAKLTAPLRAGLSAGLSSCGHTRCWWPAYPECCSLWAAAPSPLGSGLKGPLPRRPFTPWCPFPALFSSVLHPFCTEPSEGLVPAQGPSCPVCPPQRLSCRPRVPKPSHSRAPSPRCPALTSPRGLSVPPSFDSVRDVCALLEGGCADQAKPHPRETRSLG